MNRYVIEREMPGAGALNASQLRDAAARSNAVLDSLGSEIRWDHSYVTDDKLYCVYEASSEDLVRRHAEQSGFPANRISKVHARIDPSSGRAAA